MNGKSISQMDLSPEDPEIAPNIAANTQGGAAKPNLNFIFF